METAKHIIEEQLADGSPVLCKEIMEDRLGEEIMEDRVAEDKDEEIILYTVTDGSEPNFCKKDNLTEFSHASPQRVPVSCPKKKLLILDINGLLVDMVSPPPRGYKADIYIARKAVFKRPWCSDFLNFCFYRYDVAFWSSRIKKNLDGVVDFLMGDMKHKLLFCWDSSHCTQTGFNTLENKHKPIVFKELRKLWNKDDSGLPWEKGYYNESNTLLVDDSPYKALLNPPHTAIFPYSYKFWDMDDNSLGSGGDIRVYLEDLHQSKNVQKYVDQHPFGQSAINTRHQSWHFYHTVTNSVASLSIQDNSPPSSSVIEPPRLKPIK